MDQKIDDLFDKIKRVTSDWNAYVVTSPLVPIQENNMRIQKALPIVNELRHNPERSTPKAVSKSPTVYKSSTKRINRQISQGPSVSSKNQFSNIFPLNFQSVSIIPKNRPVQITDFKLGRSLGSGKFG